MTSDFWFVLIHGKIWATCRLKVPPPEESVPQLPASPTVSGHASWPRGVCKLAFLMTLNCGGRRQYIQDPEGCRLPAPSSKATARASPRSLSGPQELLTLDLGPGSGKARSCLGFVVS